MATAIVGNNNTYVNLNSSYNKSPFPTNDDKYYEVMRLLKFNSNKKLITQLIEEIDTDYLLESSSTKKDWTKNHPRYLALFGIIFSEGHPSFNFMLSLLVNDLKHKIELRDYDLLYIIILGIFWRYYYEDDDIKNYAISELKASSYYSSIEKVPYDQDIEYLLSNTGLDKEYPQFKRYGKTLGYINGRWFYDHSIYDEECKMIDAIHYYNMIGWVHVEREDIKKTFNTTASFKFRLKSITSEIDFTENKKWFCIIHDTQVSSLFVILQGCNISSYYKSNDMNMDLNHIYEMNESIVKTLQKNAIIPILDLDCKIKTVDINGYSYDSIC